MQQVLARTRALLRPLTLTCAVALGGAAAPAVAAPVTLAPGESLLFNVDATAYTYTGLRVFADISDATAGDGFTRNLFTELNGAGSFSSFSNGTLGGNDINLGQVFGVSGLNDGIFSVSLGTNLGSLSSLTFDDFKVVLFTGTFLDPTQVAVLSIPTGTVPEPSTLALLSLGLLGAGLIRRRQQ